MGLVDYISRQPNREAKVTNKYDEEFAVGTITRIRDAIAAIFVNTTQQNYQSQHFISVDLENFANATHIHLNSSQHKNSTQIQHHSKLNSNISQIHTISHRTMRSPRSIPQNPPTRSRLTFQSTPNSAVSSTHSSNEGPNSSNLEWSKEEVFENNLTQLFTKGFLGVLTSKDAVLKEVRDCILQNDAQRCKEMNLYLFPYWRYLHVRSGCVCVDEHVAIPHSILDAVLESLYRTQPGSWGMITLGQYAFWPYMHREILNKAATCKPCTDICNNLKPVVPASKWKPLLNCSEPNEEIQIDFGGPITNEKDQEINFLACIDRFSKYPTVEVFDKANGKAKAIF